MDRLQEAIGLGLVLGFFTDCSNLLEQSGVPNFTQGSMTIHTETTSKQTETINSIDYATGWQYSVSGTNVSNNGASLLPPAVKKQRERNSIRRDRRAGNKFDNWINFSNANFTITRPGEAFQFTSSYMGPGMTNQTIIQRTTEVTSVTDTTSIFTQ